MTLLACISTAYAATSCANTLGGCQVPPPPQPFNKNINNAIVKGTINFQEQTATGTITLQDGAGPTITSTANAATKTTQTWAPHAYIRSQSYTSNGKRYVKIYMSTQSAYAPNGDSGTFIYDASGNLVSGNQADVTRLNNEIIQADPIVASWWGDLIHKAAGCVATIGAAGLAATVGAASFGAGVVVGVILAGALQSEVTACF